MKLRRCAVLYLESREALAIDWKSVLSGGNALAASTHWVALAPHLDLELDVSAEQVAALGAIGQTVWSERADAERRFGEDVVARLLAFQHSGIRSLEFT